MFALDFNAIPIWVWVILAFLALAIILWALKQLGRVLDFVLTVFLAPFKFIAWLFKGSGNKGGGGKE